MNVLKDLVLDFSSVCVWRGGNTRVVVRDQSANSQTIFWGKSLVTDSHKMWAMTQMISVFNFHWGSSETAFSLSDIKCRLGRKRKIFPEICFPLSSLSTGCLFLNIEGLYPLIMLIRCLLLFFQKSFSKAQQCVIIEATHSPQVASFQWKRY